MDVVTVSSTHTSKAETTSLRGGLVGVGGQHRIKGLQGNDEIGGGTAKKEKNKKNNKKGIKISSGQAKKQKMERRPTKA